MKITHIKFYNGARQRICRLGMCSLFLEVLDIFLNTEVYILEEKDANGAAALRKMIDSKFEEAGEWSRQVSGGVDWKKKLKYNDIIAVTLGVEVQVSARSDLLIRDIVHLRNSLQEGEIDTGIIVVPDDRLQRFLPDRTPCFSDAIRYAEQEFSEAMNYPIVIIAIEHDGPSDEPLPKQSRSG